MKFYITVCAFIFMFLAGSAQQEFSTYRPGHELLPMAQVNDSLLPPAGLQAEVTASDVLLTWFPPMDGPGQWFTYSDSTLYTLIGLTGGGTFQAAAKWDPEQLEGFDGEYLTRVEFIPGSETAGYILRIWKGEFAETLLYQQVIEETDSLNWNQVVLDVPVQIDAGEMLWVGFKINQLANQFPMGVDEGPAVQDYGDLIQYDSSGWFSLTSLGLNFNWNIRAFVTLGSPPSGKETVLGDSGARGAGNFPPSGYNIYRNEEKLNADPVTELQYEDLSLPDGLYTYGVTAIYDTAESSPAVIDVLIGGPELYPDPDSLALTVPSDSMVDTLITLYNIGGESLTWNAQASDGWLTLGLLEGEIPPGDSMQVSISADATGFVAGGYLSGIVFSTNDINDPESTVPVLMNVTGVPEIVITPDTLDFGEVLVNESISLQLMIMNEGTDDLTVSGISSSSEFFEINEGEFFLNPGEYAIAEVTFLPVDVTDYTAVLTINSDDPANPAATVTLQGSGTLAPPLNLQGTLDDNVVSLSWLDPAGGPGNWLYYGSGSTYTAIGLTEGGIWRIAARWDADQLTDYVGEYLVKTRFFFYTGVAEYTLKIWEMDSLPTLITDQYVGLVEDSASWVEVFLDDPLLIDGEKDLLIGFEINQESGAFPAGVDEGPAITGYGDLVSFDGITWEQLSSYGLDFNWSLQAFISGAKGPVQMPGFTQEYPRYPNKVFSKTRVMDSSPEPFNTTRELTGYQVYRNDTLLTDGTISETSFQDTISSAGTFSYTVTAVYDEGESPPAGPVTFTIDSIFFLIPQGWNLVESDVHHNVMIPTTISDHPENSLRPGDWAGTFFIRNNQLVLAGMAMWDGTDAELTAFGDHYLTPEKDGFLNGDSLIWQIYRHTDGRTYEATALYDESFPDHGGIFNSDGLSALRSLKINALGVEENDQFADISVYPVPAETEIHIEGLPENTTVLLMGMDGRKMLEDNHKGSTRSIDLSDVPGGMYILLFTSPKGVSGRKVLVK